MQNWIDLKFWVTNTITLERLPLLFCVPYPFDSKQGKPDFSTKLKEPTRWLISFTLHCYPWKAILAALFLVTWIVLVWIEKTILSPFTQAQYTFTKQVEIAWSYQKCLAKLWDALSVWTLGITVFDARLWKANLLIRKVFHQIEKL